MFLRLNLNVQNGELAKMQIIKAPDYSENHRETVWIFETIKKVE